MREVLTLERLRSLGTEETAALLTVRRSDGGERPGQRIAHRLAGPRYGERAGLGEGAGRVARVRQRRGRRDPERDAPRGAQARPTPAIPRSPMAMAAAVLVLLTGGLFAVLQADSMLDRRAGPAAAAQRFERQAAGRRRGDLCDAQGPARRFQACRWEPPDSRHRQQGRCRVRFRATQSPAGEGPRVLRREARSVAADRRPRGGPRSRGPGHAFRRAPGSGLVRVVLVEGRVSVTSASAAAPPTVLNAGEQLVDRTGLLPVVSPGARR